MRQGGIIAAAGIYALDHHIRRLAQDHLHAHQLAAALAQKDFTADILPVETNIVIFKVQGRFTAKALAASFREQGILTIAIAPTQVRMVTHLDISPAMIDKTIEVIRHI